MDTIAKIVKEWGRTGREPLERDLPKRLPTAEVYKYREYERDPNKPHVSNYAPRYTRKQWAEFKQHFKDRGYWQDGEYVMLIIGRNGAAYVGEGTHRLTFSYELGLPYVPVYFVFYQRAHGNTPGLSTVQIVDPAAWDADHRAHGTGPYEPLRKARYRVLTAYMKGIREELTDTTYHIVRKKHGKVGGITEEAARYHVERAKRFVERVVLAYPDLTWDNRDLTNEFYRLVEDADFLYGITAKLEV